MEHKVVSGPLPSKPPLSSLPPVCLISSSSPLSSLAGVLTHDHPPGLGDVSIQVSGEPSGTPNPVSSRLIELTKRRALDRPYVVGISGGSGSGKSQFVQLLTKQLSLTLHCTLLRLSLDQFYHSGDKIPNVGRQAPSPLSAAIHRASRPVTPSESPKPTGNPSGSDQSAQNYDHPKAFDWKYFRRIVGQLLEPEPDVELPFYDFEQHCRSERTERVTQRPDILFIEGLFVFYNPEIRNLMDFRLYIDTPPDIRLVRRVRRDLHERGRTIESILAQYEQTVRIGHQAFIEPSKQYAHLIIPEGAHNEQALEFTYRALVHKLSLRSPDLTKLPKSNPKPPVHEASTDDSDEPEGGK